MSNPKYEKAILQYPRFTQEIAKRLETGSREYGDASFGRPAGALLNEIQQELLDVCGWAFILWHKLEELREQANG